MINHTIKMDKTIEVFKELSSLRTGRANAAMLDLVSRGLWAKCLSIKLAV